MYPLCLLLYGPHMLLTFTYLVPSNTELCPSYSTVYPFGAVASLTVNDSDVTLHIIFDMTLLTTLIAEIAAVNRALCVGVCAH